jgi:hypothetical protein
MPPGHPASCDCYIRYVEEMVGAVEDMIEAGSSFTRVQEATDSMELSDELKAALRLRAWSTLGPRAQEEDARARLVLVR